MREARVRGGTMGRSSEMPSASGGRMLTATGKQSFE